jgi:hypothetical protein
LIRLLLATKLHVTGDRETDTEAYRKWRREEYRRNQSTIVAKEQHVEDVGTCEGESGDFTVVNTLKRPRLESETESEVEVEEEEEEVEEEEVEGKQVEEEEFEEEEVDEDLLSSPEPESPASIDYSTMSAAALRRDALERDPPVQVLTKEKAAATKQNLAPRLKALDLEARAERNETRVKRGTRAK